jgi:hypothetical protein
LGHTALSGAARSSATEEGLIVSNLTSEAFCRFSRYFTERIDFVTGTADTLTLDGNGVAPTTVVVSNRGRRRLPSRHDVPRRIRPAAREPPIGRSENRRNLHVRRAVVGRSCRAESHRRAARVRPHRHEHGDQHTPTSGAERRLVIEDAERTTVDAGGTRADATVVAYREVVAVPAGW